MSSSPADAFITFNFLNISKHIFGSNVVKFGECILIMIYYDIHIIINRCFISPAEKSMTKPKLP